MFGARNDSESDLNNIVSQSETLLDNVYIYNRALDEAEINSLMANTSIPTAGLVGSWNFEDLQAPDAPGTNLTVTANATLMADAYVGTATFGDLALASGVELELETASPDGFSFGTVTGDGTILGSFVARDVVAPGSSVGTLTVEGDLTLGDMSVYEWELDGTGNDMIVVTGNLTGESSWKTDWTFKVKTDQPFGPGEYLVLSFGGLTLPMGPDYDLSEAPGWRTNALEMRVTDAGEVYLDVVPEPSTLALLLAAGFVGLLGYARRRRTA